MPLYEITVLKNPADYVTIYKEKTTPKLAYEYGVSYGTEIFGVPPNGVAVVEEKPVV